VKQLASKQWDIIIVSGSEINQRIFADPLTKLINRHMRSESLLGTDRRKDRERERGIRATATEP
jgi:hypothetical protein